MKKQKRRKAFSGTAIVYHLKGYAKPAITSADYKIRFGRERDITQYRAHRLRSTDDDSAQESDMEFGRSLALIVGAGMPPEVVVKALMQVVKSISKEGLAIGREEPDGPILRERCGDRRL